MKTDEIKLMIIENFIDYYTTNDKEREQMTTMAKDYVNQDHVDEIGQALGLETDDSTYVEIDKDLNVKPSIPEH